ncbi:MAG: hypothetical protein IH957_03650 [Chloroflexi bacterium]|nr:hypothetical protein [Chloroflexota bacterium]
MGREGVIRRVKPYLLHGEQYYEIVYSYADEPDALRQARVAHTNIYASPEAGDEVEIDAILSVITEIRKKE